MTKSVGHNFLAHPRRFEIDQEYTAKIQRATRCLIPVLERISRKDTDSTTGRFTEERANGDVVHKIQTMRQGIEGAASHRLLVIRRLGLDELPQLDQVAAGSLTLLGSRAVRKECLTRMELQAPDTNPIWKPQVYEAYPRAVIGLGSLVRRFYPDPHSPEADQRAQAAEINWSRTVDEADYIRLIHRVFPAQFGAMAGLRPEHIIGFALRTDVHVGLTDEGMDVNQSPTNL